MPSSRNEFINPARIVIALIIAVVIWYLPVGLTKPVEYHNAAGNAVTIDGDIIAIVEYPLHGKLNSAIEISGASAACNPACERDRCENWVSCEGAAGQQMECCTAWTVICQCGNNEPPPPPVYQPPTISHVLTCTQSGESGWCKGNLSLDLTASDPQNAQVVISGDVDGNAFVCLTGDTTCSITLPEGIGTANYKVDSAHGLSDSDTMTFAVDSSTPQLDGTISGAVGADNWYISNVALTVTASDLVSGIASLEMIIDGGQWTAVSIGQQFVFSDGIHTYQIRTTDYAGNTTEIMQQTIQVDTFTPTLDLSLSGTSGLGNWYVSNVTITPSANDSGSGLAKLEVSQDGSQFTNYQSPFTFSDGIHAYNFRATDHAGNVAENGGTLNIDTTTPILNISTSGILGLNNWYTSNATITPTASDAGSGIATFEVSQDNSQFINSQSPIIFFDGVHSYSYKVTDYAGNITETTQVVKVDTITPSISLNVNGTRGQNDWYVSGVTITPTATDATSGVATLEVSQNNSQYANYAIPEQSGVDQSTSFTDGIHNYQFKVTDNAGNITEIPIQRLSIDTIAPVINMDEELKLGETLYYDIEDPAVNGQENSGLYMYRAVIEDDNEQYKKIVWVDALIGDKARDSILWDGKFADDAQAGIGEYFITLKISDVAGNERMQTAIVKVGLLSFLQEIPAFTPPTSSVPITPNAGGKGQDALTFGGETSNATGASTSASSSAGGTNNATAGTESASISAGGTTVFNNETDFVKSGFTQGNESTIAPITNSNILWGAIATAVLGATLYDWQKKREEEEKLRIEAWYAAHASSAGQEISTYKFKKQEYERINGLYQQALWQRQQAYDDFHAQEHGYAVAQAQAIQQQAHQQAHHDFHAQEHEYAVSQAARPPQNTGGSHVMPVPVKVEEPPKWWENVLGWVDTHQPAMSILTGIGVGVIAVAGTIVVIGTAAITLPIMAVVAGAALLTSAVLAGVGTIALNSYFDRPLTTNIRENVQVAAVTATVVSGVGLFVVGGLLTQATIAAGNAIAGTCAANPMLCANAGTVLNVVDALEESSLALKLTIETATGNPQAGETAIELQLEQMDGGIPGNSVVAELAEQIAKLGPDATELVAKHGTEIIPLLLQYGDDAVDIIVAYGDEGVALLRKFGNNTDEAVSLVKEFGTPAVELLDIIDPIPAGKLLKTLDNDVIDYTIKQGPDAVAALSSWSDHELIEYGPELALRAEKDATALQAIKSLVNLGSLDPKHLTTEQEDLIKMIAENSMQYTDEGQIVLGKWVDYGNGFTSYARETGSVHYNPHPDMWGILGDLGDARRDEAAWLVNKEVIQIGVNNGLPFEYALSGLSPDKLELEEYAIEKIWEGGPSTEMIYDNVKESLGADYVPVRLRELVELYSAGYVYSFDSITNSYILIRP